MNNTLIILVGESGCGKSTIANALHDRHNLSVLDSYTTRPKRSQDETGHIFVTDEEFDKLTDLVAYTEFDGYRYCGTTEQVENNDVYILDVNGIDYFKKHYKGDKKILVIYIKSSVRTRVDRMVERQTDSDSPVNKELFDAIIKRVENDFREFDNVQDICDIIVPNNYNTDINKLVDRIWWYIDNDEQV